MLECQGIMYDSVNWHWRNPFDRLTGTRGEIPGAHGSAKIKREARQLSGSGAKGVCKMREWQREGYTVEERSFDYSLHCFAVVVPGKKEQVITPGSIEEMNSIIADLDAGADVDGWEDGMGNTIYTDPEFLKDTE